MTSPTAAPAHRTQDTAADPQHPTDTSGTASADPTSTSGTESSTNTGTDAPARIEADLLVIGWGKGGKTLAAAQAAAGKRVVMVEASPRMYGGTCINIGCVPTKALVHAANARRAGEDEDLQAYFDSAVDTRDALIAKLNDVNYHMLADRDTVTVLDGRARFIGERTVIVEPGPDAGDAPAVEVSGQIVIVNTGSEPVLPPIPGSDSALVHDSTSLQHVEPFPARLGIIGAGPIGLEFADMFADFGSAVTLIAQDERILPREDADVAAAVHESLLRDGIDFRLSTGIERFEETADGLRLHLSGGQSLEVDAALLAIGRRPATAGLDLAAAGIDVDDHGAIVVDEQLRTSAPGVFAIGDVKGGLQQTYISLDDSRIVASALAGDGARSTADRTVVPATVFLTPPLSSVGMTEAEAVAAGHEVLTVCAPVAGIKAMPRPKIVGDPRGVIKFVVDAADDAILGARLFHVDSQEVINLVALAMRTGMTASQLRDGIYTHPSSTEALNEVLGQLAAPQG